MSPAMRLKSRDKFSGKVAARDHRLEQKAHTKLSMAPVNARSMEAATLSSPPSPAPESYCLAQAAGEQSGSSSGAITEYDSLSTNGSCSGESEDLKERPAAVGPSAGSDIEKRDKIRQKNERKHQRQRERRAQELHERAQRSLMAWKLKTLSQKLVAMGFPLGRVTTALLLNKGRVEESAVWLLDGGEEAELLRGAASLSDLGDELNIDISEELTKIANLEASLQCSKQEVERAIVACDGNLERAAETLKTLKPVSPLAPSKDEVSSEPPAASRMNKVAVTMPVQNLRLMRTQVKVAASSSARCCRRGTKWATITQGGCCCCGISVISSQYQELAVSTAVTTAKAAEWAKPPDVVVGVVDKRWPGVSATGAQPPVSALPSSPVVAPPAKSEARHVAAWSEPKTVAQVGGALREPVIVMQRPQQPAAAKNSSNSSRAVLNAPPPVTSGQYPVEMDVAETSKPVAAAAAAVALGLGHLGRHQNQNQNQNQFRPFVLGSVGATAAASSLTLPPSLGSMVQCDYATIDWSLDSTPCDLGGAFRKSQWLYDDAWPLTVLEKELGMSGGRIHHKAGLQVGGLAVSPPPLSPSPAAVAHEWTSPFAGKDLFCLSRQFGASPSL
ncbi:unnamed protein product [Spirodela intermedia]|uniref:UBA domain-containing protein n=1 Tax=Spirodela intermedia TaxID=51605 RepID=A0A7I8J047_SPIIN|nr:unnamed protein product [Spirodela intermedia]CAA6663596.1 unnamed protein product [Spirodela intermedia]